MKKILLSLAIAGTALTSCQPSEKKLEKDQENIQDAQQKFAQDWAKYKQDQDEKIRENEVEINNYRDKIRDAKESERVTLEKRTNDLDEKNKALRARINDYDKDRRQDKWEEFKREFDHDMDELGNSLRDIGKNNVK
jgi:hypothetical protein